MQGFRFYNIKELTRLLGITKDEYHDNIKNEIKRDFKDELVAIGVRNPDIWLDANFNICLVDPTNSANYYKTNPKTNIFSYK